jgi:hypothetical protein
MSKPVQQTGCGLSEEAAYIHLPSPRYNRTAVEVIQDKHLQLLEHVPHETKRAESLSLAHGGFMTYKNNYCEAAVSIISSCTFLASSYRHSTNRKLFAMLGCVGIDDVHQRQNKTKHVFRHEFRRMN